MRISNVLGEAPLFLLNHPDMRGSGRVRALSEHIMTAAPVLLRGLNPPRATRPPLKFE